MKEILISIDVKTLNELIDVFYSYYNNKAYFKNKM